MMRVLHISSGNMFGGIEAMLVTLARRRQVCPGMRPEFAFAFDGRIAAELRRSGVPVHILGDVRVSRPWTVIRARRALARLLKRERHDVVLCHAPWPHAVFGPVVRRAARPLVLWAHSGARRHWTDRWAGLTTPDLVIANSCFTAEHLAASLRTVPGKVLYCPVDRTSPANPETRSAVRHALGLSSEEVVILQAGRLEPWKGQGVLIDALASIRNRSGWTCLIVGYPQNDQHRAFSRHLQAKVDAHGLASRVRFIESRTHLQPYYDAADVFCQVNTMPEPFGIVFIEAMLAGLPVITTAMGGAAEFVDDEIGRTLDGPDATQLAKALDELCVSKALRSQLGSAGRTRAEMLASPLTQLRKLESICERLLAPALERLSEQPLSGTRA